VPLKRPRKRIRRDTPQAQLELRSAATSAALTIYLRQGLDGLTMRAVASRVGVTPMALYRYFTNKTELLRALGEVALNELLAEVRAAIAPLATARERVRVSALAYIAYWERHPEHYRLVFLEGGRPELPLNNPRLADASAYHQGLELATELFNDYADEIGGDRSRVPLARDLRLALVMGYLQARLVYSRYPWHDNDRLREQIVDTVVTATAACLHGGGAPAVTAAGST
jgi:AcrR family transcriptional regulator